MDQRRASVIRCHQGPRTLPAPRYSRWRASRYVLNRASGMSHSEIERIESSLGCADELFRLADGKDNNRSTCRHGSHRRTRRGRGGSHPRYRIVVDQAPPPHRYRVSRNRAQEDEAVFHMKLADYIRTGPATHDERNVLQASRKRNVRTCASSSTARFQASASPDC